MKFLITNSDDFGMNEAITDAILETHLNGIMTSTTLMVNMPGFEYAINKAIENPSLGVGIHLNLTEGRSVSPMSLIPDLLDDNGVFKCNSIQRRNLLFSKKLYKQVCVEFKAQFEKMIDSGLIPSHYDSHHHITGVPVAFMASMDVAKALGIRKARITNIDFHYIQKNKVDSLKRFSLTMKNLPKAVIHAWNKRTLRSNGFITPDSKLLPTRVIPSLSDDVENFIQALSVLKSGCTEISFHPGYLNSNPSDSLNTANLRIRDLKIATSKEVIKCLADNQIKLISFRDL